MADGFATEADGKYSIRVGQQNGRWAARAFRGRQTITDRLEAADRAGAVEAVRQALREMRTARRAERGSDGSPSAAEYREAFSQVMPLHPNHLAMLKAHLHAPDHLISATQLAAAAGYPNWNAANLQYGLLAQRVAEELDYEPPVRPDGSPIWTATLATWPADGDLPADRLLASLERHADHPHFEWNMRPQVGEVVRDL